MSETLVPPPPPRASIRAKNPPKLADSQGSAFCCLLPYEGQRVMLRFSKKAICPLEDASAAFRSMGDRVKPSCRFSGAHGHQQISCEVSLRNKYWGSTMFHSSLIQRFRERLMFSWFLGLRGSSLAQVKRLTSTAPFLLSNRLSGRLFHTRAFIEHLWCAREGGNSRISVP